MTDLDNMSSVEEFTVEYAEGGSLEPKQELPIVCSQCKNPFSEPVVLNCLHIFDRGCLSKFECTDNIFPIVTCPKCNMQSGSLSSLKPYITQYAIDSSINKPEINFVESTETKTNAYKCVLCTNGDDSKYKCIDCAGLLCERCKALHKEVKFLNSHLEVQELSPEDKIDIDQLKKHLSDNKPVKCEIHTERKYSHYCVQCGMLACARCMISDHVDHSVVLLEEFPTMIRQHRLLEYIDNCRQSEVSYRNTIDRLNSALIEVSNSHDENRSHIEEVAQEWKKSIDEIKTEYLKRNKDLHDELEFRIMNGINQSEKHLEHIEYALEFTRSYLDKCSNVEFCKIIKVVLNCLTDLADRSSLDVDGEDIINDIRNNITFKEKTFSALSNLIRSNFGVFLHQDHHSMYSGNDKSSSVSSMIEFPNDMSNCGFNPSAQSILLTPLLSTTNNAIDQCDIDHAMHYKRQTSLDQNPYKQCHAEGNLFIPKSGNAGKNAITASNSNNNNIFEVVANVSALGSNSPVNVTSYSSLLSSSSGVCNRMDIINSSSSIISDVVNFPFPGQFENHTQFDENGVMILPMLPNTTQASPVPTFPQIDTFNGSIQNGYNVRPNSVGYNPNPRPPFPNRGSQCAAMTVKARWGSLGSGRGEMSSPHGFCLGFSEEIVVADTQNHRIQIFTKEGQLLSQFGVAGRDEGQLWFPRKVAIIRSTQRYVVCDRGNERSRMQIFGRSGHFLRKISIRYIDIVAGLAVNNMGHIVAVDSVSPSVFVVSEGGELIKWFDCSSCMREPSDIAVHGDEYFICDFKGHCVCVFKQDGNFVQRFGNETITNFPNGIDVSDHGDVLIGDSHGNRFHIAVYSRDGKLMSEFECPSIKVSRACGLKITSEGYLVTLAKNNHHVLVMDTLYIS